MYGEVGCEVNWPTIPTFKTGRRDCIPDPDAKKAWHAPANRHEIHPSPHGNGPETIKFYKNSFGLNAREAIALNSGGHSLASFKPQTSYFAYEWTRAQSELFNNQLLKALAARDEYFSNCKDWSTGKYTYPGPWALVGDAWGNKAKTSWRVWRKKFTKNGGPYQWHHMYYR